MAKMRGSKQEDKGRKIRVLRRRTIEVDLELYESGLIEVVPLPGQVWRLKDPATNPLSQRQFIKKLRPYYRAGMTQQDSRRPYIAVGTPIRVVN